MTGQLDDSTIYEARVALDDLRDAWSLLDPEERATNRAS